MPPRAATKTIERPMGGYRPTTPVTTLGQSNSLLRIREKLLFALDLEGGDSGLAFG